MPFRKQTLWAPLTFYRSNPLSTYLWPNNIWVQKIQDSRSELLWTVNLSCFLHFLLASGSWNHPQNSPKYAETLIRRQKTWENTGPEDTWEASCGPAAPESPQPLRLQGPILSAMNRHIGPARAIGIQELTSQVRAAMPTIHSLSVLLNFPFPPATFYECVSWSFAFVCVLISWSGDLCMFSVQFPAGSSLLFSSATSRIPPFSLQLFFSCPYPLLPLCFS